MERWKAEGNTYQPSLLYPADNGIQLSLGSGETFSETDFADFEPGALYPELLRRWEKSWVPTAEDLAIIKEMEHRLGVSST